MGERPEDVRRDPRGRGGPGPVPPAENPAFDPATDAFEPQATNPNLADRRDEAGTDEVGETRADIERTRADMRETVDAIQEKMSPRNIKERATEQAKGKARNTGSAIMEAVRQNPIPAALTGIGLGWLFMSARQQGYQARTYPYDYSPRYGQSGSSAGQALDRTQSRVGETASQAQDRAGQVASQAQDRAGQVASQAQAQASQLGSQAQDQAQRVRGGFERMLQENPLAVGALAVAAGAAVGLAFPETRKEHEVMGEARDRVVDRAQEKAQETQQKAQRVAEEAQSAAREEARNQGLGQE